MIEGTQAPSDRRTTLKTTPNYDDSNTDEMDIKEIVERSRDFKCKAWKYSLKTV